VAVKNTPRSVLTLGNGIGEQAAAVAAGSNDAAAMRRNSLRGSFILLPS
jgi:hypothetical protein